MPLMKISPLLFTVLTAVISSVVPASAQVEAGLQEVALTGSFDRGNREFEARTTRIEVDGRYGFFATDRFSFGPEFSYFKLEEVDPDWAVSGFVHMHLGNAANRLVPYLRAGYGQFFGSDLHADNPTFVSGGAGLKLFAGEGGGALDMSAFYRRVLFETGGAPNFATGRHDIGVKVGVAVYFGR